MPETEGSRLPLSTADVSARVRDAGLLWPPPVVVARTGSTNDDLATLAAEGAPEGTCVVADEQTAGRGRLDRAWSSPPGAGLWTSVLVRAGDQPKARWGLLSLVAGLAAVEALAETCSVTAALKWPNDVVVPAAGGYRKLGGILSQTAAGDGVVLGIGINVSLGADELPVPTATSVRREGGRLDRAALLVGLLGALPVRLEQWRRSDPALLADYRAACLTLGRPVEVSLPDGAALAGVATGVDDDGHLVVEDASGEHVVAAGDVVHATL